MKKLNFIFLLFFILTFISCDKYNDVSYIVENQTSDSLKLKFDYSKDYYGIETGDTIMFLAGNSKKEIFIHTVISPQVYNPETEDYMLYIVNFDILRLRDSSMFLKDVTLRKNWIYQEIDDNYAEIRFEVNDSDF